MMPSIHGALSFRAMPSKRISGAVGRPADAKSAKPLAAKSPACRFCPLKAGRFLVIGHSLIEPVASRCHARPIPDFHLPARGGDHRAHRQAHGPRLRARLPARGGDHRAVGARAGGGRGKCRRTRPARRGIRRGAHALPHRPGAAPGPVVGTAASGAGHGRLAGRRHRRRRDARRADAGHLVAHGAGRRVDPGHVVHSHRAAIPRREGTAQDPRRRGVLFRAAFPGHRRHPHPGGAAPARPGRERGAARRRAIAGSRRCPGGRTAWWCSGPWLR